MNRDARLSRAVFCRKAKPSIFRCPHGSGISGSRYSTGRIGFRAILGVPADAGRSPNWHHPVMRRAPKPFTDRQIELAETFADQAVIAIENVRLFDEVQTRTRDLAESFNNKPPPRMSLRRSVDRRSICRTVLDALIETAARMSDADQGAITREIDGAFFRAATYGYSAAFSDFIHSTPVQMDRSSIAGRALVEGRIVQIADVMADPDYTFSPALDSGDFRTALWRSNAAGGRADRRSLSDTKDVRLFTDKQIELVHNLRRPSRDRNREVRLFESARPARVSWRVTRGVAHYTGPPGADTEARVAWPAHRRHRARDQEPTQFRQQFLGDFQPN